MPPRAKGRRDTGEGYDASHTTADLSCQNMLTQHLHEQWATWYTYSEQALGKRGGGERDKPREDKREIYVKHEPATLTFSFVLCHRVQFQCGSYRQPPV